jgi:hypothetical protein
MLGDDPRADPAQGSALISNANEAQMYRLVWLWRCPCQSALTVASHIHN